MTNKHLLYTLLTILSVSLLWNSKAHAQTNAPAWTKAAPPTPRHGLGVATVGNRIFVFGTTPKTGGDFVTTTHEVLVLSK